ncbi:MAG: hypothetical protein AAF840_16120, partial [Bacteroidota bacterium]
HGRVIPRKWESFNRQTSYIVSPLQYPEVEVKAVDSVYLRHLSGQFSVREIYYPIGRLPKPPRAWTNAGVKLEEVFKQEPQ